MGCQTWKFQVLHYRSAEPADLSAFADHLAGHYVPNSVIVDATASEAPAAQYLEWMKKGIHIITPNKKLNSGPLEQYRALKQFQRESYIHYLYEVGPWTLDESLLTKRLQRHCLPAAALRLEGTSWSGWIMLLARCAFHSLTACFAVAWGVACDVIFLHSLSERQR